jgi:ANTAR domain
MNSKRGRRARAAADAAVLAGAAAVDEVTATGAGGSGSSVAGGSGRIDAVTAGATAVGLLAADNAVVRRTKDGWRVGSDDLPDLTCAMVLADLLAAEDGTAATSPPKPGEQPAAASEAGRLRATISQLEHALATRIRVEQAIGVLAERHRIKPREAFEQLRDAARSRGRKVIDIAGDVVASASNPLLQLPDELSRPRSAARRGMHQPSGA